MFKVGQKVKIKSLECQDENDTDLKVGSMGEVKRTDGIGTYVVDFGNIRCCGANQEYDGYWMYEEQLELFVESEAE